MRRIIYITSIICVLLSMVFVASVSAAPSRADRGPWAAGIAYAVNDTTTYGGCTYKVLQAHTSQADWTPPAVPALFQQLSCGGGSTPTRTNTPSGPVPTATRTNTPGGPTATRTNTPSAATATRTPTSGPTSPPGSKIFAPYIDVSPGSGSSIMHFTTNGANNKHYTLAFILGYGCAASWFGAYQLNTAEAAGINDRVNELKATGGNVIIAFGGAAAPELANVCPNVSALQTQYQAVVNMYHPYAIDMDIEDFNPTAIDIRNKALKNITGTRIHYTLGVLETGFTQAQMDVLNNARTNGTPVHLVNLMVMDYGHPVSNMYTAAVSAAQAARTWLNNNGFASTQLGLTPMIGQNDSAGEIFTTANASSLVSWANSNGVTLLAFWSIGRDNGGCPGQTSASPSCSGVSQSNFQFSSIFHGFAP